MRHTHHFRTLAVSLLLAASACLAWASDLQVDLNGFRLEQYVSAADASFGTPFKEVDQGDTLLRAYRIDDDAYMVVGHSKSRPHNISVLQLTGRTKKALPFRALNLGDEKRRVLEVLGAPTREVAIPSQKLTKLSYEGSNFSVELDDSDRLYSILIYSTAALFQPGAKHSDALTSLLERLEAGRLDQLLDVLRPDVEIYRGGRTLAIRKRLSDFVANPDADFMSALFSRVDGVLAELKSHKAEPALRFVENFGVGQVYKFPPESRLIEIAFFLYNGEFRVYEVAFRE